MRFTYTHCCCYLATKWCLKRRLLKRPLDCKEIQPVHPRGDQSWVFTGRMDVKLKLQYFGHLIWRAASFEKILILGKIEGRRRRGWQRMRWLDGITDWDFPNPGIKSRYPTLQAYSLPCEPPGKPFDEY